MMDLYEAIEVLADYLATGVTYYKYNSTVVGTREPDTDEIEAMKICLEAAKDKAGV